MLGNKFISFGNHPCVKRAPGTGYANNFEQKFLLDEIHAQYCAEVREGNQNSVLKDLLVQLRNYEPRTGFSMLLYLCSIVQSVQNNALNINQFRQNTQSSGLKKLKRTSQADDSSWNKVANLLHMISNVETNARVDRDFFKAYLNVISHNKHTFLIDCQVC